MLTALQDRPHDQHPRTPHEMSQLVEEAQELFGGIPAASDRPPRSRRAGRSPLVPHSGRARSLAVRDATLRRCRPIPARFPSPTPSGARTPEPGPARGDETRRSASRGQASGISAALNRPAASASAVVCALLYGIPAPTGSLAAMRDCRSCGAITRDVLAREREARAAGGELQAGFPRSALASESHTTRSRRICPRPCQSSS